MMNSMSLSLDSYILDLADQRFLRNGEPVPLRRKTFEVLAQLASHPGRLLTKEELIDAVWPCTFVSDTVLKVCICELRKALEDSSRTSVSIETVYGRGYRLAGPPILVRSGPRG